ncbi:hypothetical protein [Longimicrobium terrae]|uniref:Uncharacterized protein n=1 Tax=Longimicrobium terrae TaxID=1639882 RepID=A0A841H6L7_9BACT|nr:hypothetical protein [Longimicrobium terrae]MBB4638270.1 hypothetical protein [Longimicrobium terrae]MBB6073760.1 hypothetical protein [Longimicrobium terrae]NNC30253.1 hypothetical protein [Longimicrobium terrae]
MENNNDCDPQRGHAAFARSVVISEPGAAIRVECIELTGALKRSLTTSITSLGPRGEPRRRRAGG